MIKAYIHSESHGKLRRLGNRVYRMHFVKDIVGIIFSLQLLQAAQVGTVDI